jgi:hypothetical protein
MIEEMTDASALSEKNSNFRKVALVAQRALK